MPVNPPKLHLDADASRKVIERALRAMGHDVTRTPNHWITLDADDLAQLTRATEHGRILFTFNVADFMALANQQSAHTGIVLAHQRSWSTKALIAALHHLLSTTSAHEWVGQVRWLNDWRDPAD